MRKVNVAKIRDAVRDLCLEANFVLRRDIMAALKKALSNETDMRSWNIIRSIVENAWAAKSGKIAICQDTGLVSVFLEIGQGVALAGGDLEKAVNDGVREAYKKGFLRKSVVADPLLRKNTGTNTPCVIYTAVVPGVKVKITVAPKGFGSENRSRIKMFRPTASVDAIKKFVLETAREAGADACPPFVIGVGMGGTFDKAAYLAKKALLRSIDRRNPKRHIGRLEEELLEDINSLGIGPMGLGGKTTALGVNILEYPTHIAGLPVAVNVSCHATRSAERVV